MQIATRPSGGDEADSHHPQTCPFEKLYGLQPLPLQRGQLAARHTLSPHQPKSLSGPIHGPSRINDVPRDRDFLEPLVNDLDVLTLEVQQDQPIGEPDILIKTQTNGARVSLRPSSMASLRP
ncbi:hypothetical protein [Acrocarpospora sp. B8E8]|uniref:hypothetical protein n=1 Tax=Acrocarpospora sp. B8E8 TaxID=3153572 RepID=UPI00325E854D